MYNLMTLLHLRLPTASTRRKNDQMPTMKCVVSVLFLLVGVLIADVKAETYTSSTLVGQVCENDNGRRCSQRCDNGHCTCLDDTRTGVPALACIIPSHRVCSVVSDPYVHTFIGETIAYPVPCQYLLTGGVRDAFDIDGNPMNGKYEFQALAYNKRIRGKAFPSGFRVDVYRNVGGDSRNMSFMVDGSASSGSYTYVSQASADGGATWFDYQEMNKNPLIDVDNYFIHYDNIYNTLWFIYLEIGLEVAFRAPDIVFDVSEQNYLAGIVVGFRFSDDFTPDTRGFCFSLDVSSEDVLDSQLTDSAGLMMLAATNENIPQNFPDSSSECANLADPITTCDNDDLYHESINQCMTIFEENKFVNCYSLNYPDGESGSGHSVLALFKTCIRALCHLDYEDCLFMTTIINPSCFAKAPSAISGLNCSSLT